MYIATAKMNEYIVCHQGTNYTCLMGEGTTEYHDFLCEHNKHNIPETLREKLREIRNQAIRESMTKLTIFVDNTRIHFINVQEWFIDNILNLHSPDTNQTVWNILSKEDLGGRRILFDNFVFLWFSPDSCGSDDTVKWFYDKYGYETVQFQCTAHHVMTRGVSEELKKKCIGRFWKDMKEIYRQKM